MGNLENLSLFERILAVKKYSHFPGQSKTLLLGLIKGIKGILSYWHQCSIRLHCMTYLRLKILLVQARFVCWLLLFFRYGQYL